MARKILHQLVDDIDGTVLEAGDGETVLFSLDGKTYEIDLTQENASSLRDSIEQYVAAARRISGRASSAPNSSSSRSTKSGSDRDLAAIRT